MAMTACSVDDFNAPSEFGSDGEMKVTLSVPDLDKVGTRAVDEFAVNDLTMLIFSSAGFQKAVPNSELTTAQDGNNITVSYQLDQRLRTMDGLEFYFVANAPSASYTGITNSAGLKEKMLDEQWSASNMVMSAYAPVSIIKSGSSVALKRNAAKVVVNNAVADGDEWVPGNTWYPFDVYGTAVKSSIVSSTITDGTNLGKATLSNASTFAGKEEAVYVHPTKNPGRTEEGRPFVIVKADYDSKPYFYRVEFEKVAADGKVTVLDINSNYEYRVLVKEVLGPGETTSEAAAKNPSSFEKLDVVIYDVAPESYNMITDGLRELGVNHTLVHRGNPSDAADPDSFESLYVKLFTPNADEYQLTAANFSSDCDWLEFGTPVEVTDASIIGTSNSTENATSGKVYRIPVNFKANPNPGTLTGMLRVYWQGLSREVPVEWIRDFNGADLCSVKMEIQNEAGTSMAVIDDYWAFMQNGVSGVKTSQNNNQVRNSGLHFPLAYGVDENHWWKYKYDITFKDLNDGAPFDWKITTTGVTGLTLSKTEGTNTTGSVSLSITFDPKVAGWDYQTGTLTFMIKKAGERDSEYTRYSMSLYHTGFFDNPKKFRLDNQGKVLGTIEDHRADMAEQDRYYYYEVRQGPAGKYHWLDRNLGAESAAYYIEATGELTYYGDPAAAGGYYRCATYNNADGRGTPIQYTDLCPPGYEVPRDDIWNTLRNSAGFSTGQSSNGSYFLAQFTDINGLPVYFPRALYYDSNDMKTGESRSGYYWSQTAATGYEKDQIGNWLRYLKFSGSIATYDNGEVYGYRKDGNGELHKGIAMSVRCVSKSVTPNVTSRTYFRVQGVTHVYLYSLDEEGNRNAVTNWPGTPIGNYETMKDGRIASFAYESKTTTPEQFYVMFTWRDQAGIWHTMSKGDDNQTLYTTDKAPRDLKGWKVVGDTWVDPSGAEVTTALGGLWSCSADHSKTTFTEGTGPTPDPTPGPTPEPDARTYRVYWGEWPWNAHGWIYVFAANDVSITHKNGSTLCRQEANWLEALQDSNGYYIEFKYNSTSDQEAVFKCIAVKGMNNWDGQSKDYPIKTSDARLNETTGIWEIKANFEYQ